MAMQPLNQPIEMIDRERQAGLGAAWAARVARLTGDDWQATFSFRAGFALGNGAGKPPPTPEGCAESLAACDYVTDEDPVSGRPDGRR